MKKSAFNFNLPHELIAQYPLQNRSDSRMLVYHRNDQSYAHTHFSSLVDYLEPGDLLVMNDSRVIPARLYGHKSSGGKVELLVERILSDTTFLAHIKASKALKPDAQVYLSQDWQLKVLKKDVDLYLCQANGSVVEMLEKLGHIPLPPYITRNDEALDTTRYQTIYARENGSVAAPTAGLHFDDATFVALEQKGIMIAHVTLHVGAGTFRPVRTEDIRDHVMHTERFAISDAVAEQINRTKRSGKRVIAVGTTSLRTLESAAVDGQIKTKTGDTNIFIYPGYHFQICDGLLTNFHLPESTLLMLVSAFIGYEQAMHLYALAIENKYRFFSYGDASLLL